MLYIRKKNLQGSEGYPNRYGTYLPYMRPTCEMSGPECIAQPEISPEQPSMASRQKQNQKNILRTHCQPLQQTFSGGVLAGTHVLKSSTYINKQILTTEAHVGECSTTGIFSL